MQQSNGLSRSLVLGIMVIIIVIGLAIVIMSIGTAGQGQADGEERVNVLANSDDECVVCHSRNTPGIVEQYGHSTMAAA